MTTRNDVTGDKIQSKPNSEAYRNNPYWDKKAKEKDNFIEYLKTCTNKPNK